MYAGAGISVMIDSVTLSSKRQIFALTKKFQWSPAHPKARIRIWFRIGNWDSDGFVTHFWLGGFDIHTSEA